MSISSLVNRAVGAIGLVALVLATGCGNGSFSSKSEDPTPDETEETDDGCEYSTERNGAYTFEVVSCDTDNDGYVDQVTRDNKRGYKVVEYLEPEAKCPRGEVITTSRNAVTTSTTSKEYRDCTETRTTYESDGIKTVTTYELDEQNRQISGKVVRSGEVVETMAFGTCPDGTWGHIERTTYSFEKAGTTEHNFRNCERTPYQTWEANGEHQVHRE